MSSCMLAVLELTRAQGGREGGRVEVLFVGGYKLRERGGMEGEEVDVLFAGGLG